ncbi:hypothetical protein B0I35DRAFT_439092 [Stachybotrys elegans]|uniref:FAD-binding domain-containing protein n=1 Tax=Stachybotrys elegans TaxID=80388 RepID=A0A8K0SN63_9HYPO|nr:hypothetical protein B0I35DRAFT_439092 [Stachybotrys elegans]
MAEPDPPLPVIIIGAGISGLLLAQALRRQNIPVRIFERDADLNARDPGWGLTLHWSLPALRSLLPEDLVRRLPETYVDRHAVEDGACSRFPFYDLSTGRVVARTPKTSEEERVRVSRQKFRWLLTTGINVEWGKAFSSFAENKDSVIANFEDGSSCRGRLLVGCDGTNSRVRQALFPGKHETFKLPVRCLGLKIALLDESAKSILESDPFFFQGAHPGQSTFAYVSLLEAPPGGSGYGYYTYQVCVSWPYRKDWFGRYMPLDTPPSGAGRRALLMEFANGWLPPFSDILDDIPEGAPIKPLVLEDYRPDKDLQSTGRAVLMGDAFHAMVMYRGEGANHAIVDVEEFSKRIIPDLVREKEDWHALRSALDGYEKEVIARTRPAVLASRVACMDAHDWTKITLKSPLLSKREKYLNFPEEQN